MEDNDLLIPLNEAIITAMLTCDIDSARWQLAGWVRPVFDPSSPAKACLMDSQDKRFTLDSRNVDAQIAFRLAGGQTVNDTQRYGSGGATKWNLNAELLIATRQAKLLAEILREWDYLPDIQVRSFSTDSLRVLAESFLFRPGPKEPYDPKLRLYTVQFTLLQADRRDHI